MGWDGGAEGGRGRRGEGNRDSMQNEKKLNKKKHLDFSHQRVF